MSTEAVSSQIKENRIVSLDRLVPHPRNFRSHPEEQIQSLILSLQRFGQGRSIVIQDSPEHLLIVAGHGIVEAAKRLNWTELRADILPAHWSPSQIDGYLIADNLLSQQASDEESLLAILLQEQLDAGFDLAALGSDEETLRQMLESLGDEYLAGDEQEDDGTEDELPEEVETRCKPGDIWQLGRHRLLVGDCNDTENIKRLMQGQKAGMVLTDPPYGMAYEPNHDDRRVKHNYNGAGYHNVKQQSMIVGDDKPFDPTPLLNYFHDVKEQFWFGADYYVDLLPDRTKGSWLVWDKRAGIEDMEFNTSHFELCWSRTRHLREIIRVKWFGIQGTEQQDVRRRVHPTQKPLQVFNFILEKYSEEDDLIIDPYLGSGTTLISCERLGRRCFGCEIEPRFADIILARWEAKPNQTATLLDRVEVEVHA